MSEKTNGGGTSQVVGVAKIKKVEFVLLERCVALCSFEMIWIRFMSLKQAFFGHMVWLDNLEFGIPFRFGAESALHQRRFSIFGIPM